MIGRSGIFGSERQGFGQIIDALGYMNGDRFLAGKFANCIPRCGKGRQRLIACSNIRVIARRTDVKIAAKTDTGNEARDSQKAQVQQVFHVSRLVSKRCILWSAFKPRSLAES